MGKTPLKPELPRNPQTQRRHRQESWWQITFPILAGTVILLMLSVLATQMNPGETSRWSSISLIWLIAPVMLFALVSLVFLAVGIYGMARFIHKLPYYSYQALGWLLMVGGNVHRLTDRMVEPVFRVQLFLASVRTLMSALRKR